MYKKVDYPEKPCSQCGAIFKPKEKGSHLCSTECRYRSRNKSGKVMREITAHRHRVCKMCGKEYFNKRANGEGQSYCSRECSAKDQSAWTNKKHWGEYSDIPSYTVIVRKECERCSSMYYAKSVKSKRCNDCGSTTIPYIKTCNWCDKEYNPTSIGSMQCSDECKQEVGREGKRAAKARRRALLKATTVETVKPFTVFERDGWKCKACGCDTPVELRGTYDDNAPELDHIIPLSKGGEHTYKNTQCLCRVCNQLKGSKSMQRYMAETNNKHTRGRVFSSLFS